MGCWPTALYLTLDFKWVFFFPSAERGRNTLKFQKNVYCAKIKYSYPSASHACCSFHRDCRKKAMEILDLAWIKEWQEENHYFVKKETNSEKCTLWRSFFESKCNFQKMLVGSYVKHVTISTRSKTQFHSEGFFFLKDRKNCPSSGCRWGRKSKIWGESVWLCCLLHNPFGPWPFRKRNGFYLTNRADSLKYFDFHGLTS